MIDETEKDLSQTIANLVNRLVDEAYQKGYTKGVIDGTKKAEQERTLDGVQPVVPQPCVRGIDMRTMKALFLKLDEEVEEFKFELIREMGSLEDGPDDVQQMLGVLQDEVSFRIAEEGADVATMIATICNAVGVDDKTRFEAQAYVNKHNQERGRL